MKVIFYHTLTCPQCKAVEMMLKKEKIEYESCTDLDTMIARGLQHTPILEVEGNLLSGKEIFDWIRGQRRE